MKTWLLHDCKENNTTYIFLCLGWVLNTSYHLTYNTALWKLRYLQHILPLRWRLVCVYRCQYVWSVCTGASMFGLCVQVPVCLVCVYRCQYVWSVCTGASMFGLCVQVPVCLVCVYRCQYVWSVCTGSSMFGLCVQVPVYLKTVTAFLRVGYIRACMNNFRTWKFSNGLPRCCLRYFLPASFQLISEAWNDFHHC
jgi:hypothetical protein